MLNQKIRLRAGNQYIIPKIQTVQGDTGRVLVCEIEDFEIPGGATATFWAMKPSGKSVQNDVPISDQEIMVELTNQTLAERGYIQCQIEIKADGKSVKTFAFCLDNGKSLAGDWPESENENTYLEGIVEEMQAKLTETINQANTAISAANTAAQEVNTATANANAAADEARKTIWNNKNMTNSTSASESQVETAAGAAVLTGVDGKTEQVTTTGENLYPNIEEKTTNGITSNINDDGSFDLSGTGNGQIADFYAAGSALNDPDPWEDSSINQGEYILHSDDIPKGIRAYIVIKARDGSSKNIEYYIANDKKNESLSIISGDKLRIFVRADIGVAEIKSSFHIMLNSGEEQIPWEPYTGGVPGPNPDYLIPVHGVGGKTGDESFGYGNLILSGNFFDVKKSVKKSDALLTINEDGKEIIIIGKDRYSGIEYQMSSEDLKYLKGKKIKILGTNSGLYGKPIVQFFMKHSDEKYEYVSAGNSATVSEDVESIMVSIYVNNSPNALDQNVTYTFKNVMVIIDGHEEEWREYFRSELQIALTQPLFEGDKIMQVKAGQTYVDADGAIQTTDKDLYGIYKSTVMYKFDGDETWREAPTMVSTEKRFYVALVNKVKESNKTNGIHSFNTSFQLAYSGGTWSAYNSYTVNLSSTSGKNELYVRKDADTTLETFKQYLSEKPMYLVAELETPYFEPFADQTPFFAWTTPTGGCTITTDDPLEPIISADTAQTPEGSYLLTGYIDGLRSRNNENVIAALSNQVVALTQKSMEG